MDAASLWLEERSLHEIHVYLESLPPRYAAGKLNLLFQGDKVSTFAFFFFFGFLVKLA
jgi:hypothetical protein